MKLLFVVNDAGFFLSHRLPIAVAAREAGYEIYIVTPHDESARKIKSAGLTYIPWGLSRSGTNPIREIKSIISLAKILRRTKPDIVHLVTIKPVLYGGVLSRLLGLPGMVVAISGMGHLFLDEDNSKGIKKWLIQRAYRVALKHTHCKVIVQNNDDKSSLETIGAIKADNTILIKGSGVDLDLFTATKLPTDKPLVILPARMLWDKGVGIFVEAARILAAKNFSIRMALVGPCDTDNPNGVPLHQLHAWQKQNIVEWWGNQEDMPSVLSAAHLVALPSFYREGIPKCLLEASASGRAIITTDSIGCRDAIEDNISGLLIPPRNANALADAIIELIEDRQKLIDMGISGRIKAEAEYSIQGVIVQHIKIYQSLYPI